jgi:ring-1,2-phenylacetyl-CoA epoxidase subunit PaaE
MNLKFTIDDESHQLEISSDKTILDNLKDFDIPWSCLSGHCSTCMCKLICGDVDMKTNLALTDREVENGFILTCQSFAKSDIEIDFDY